MRCIEVVVLGSACSFSNNLQKQIKGFDSAAAGVTKDNKAMFGDFQGVF